MADLTHTHRSRRRRTAEPQQQNAFPAYSYPAQPHPTVLPTHDFNQTFTSPSVDAPVYETMDCDLTMQEYFGEIPASSATSMRGSVLQSLSPSWLNVAEASPSVVMEDAASSMVMIQHAHTQGQKRRTCSDNSNLESNIESQNDFVLFPTPEEEAYTHSQEQPWTPGAELAVDYEAMDEDYRHDPKLLLGEMWSAQPRIVDDPYQVFAVSKEGPTTYQELQHYQYQSVIQPQTMTQPRAVKLHSDGPWNPVDPQVSGYGPEFTVYLPSPGPQGEQDSEGGSSRASSEPHSPKLSKSRVKKSRSSKAMPGPTGKGKGKPKQLMWEHAAVSKDGLCFLSEHKEEEEKQRSGVRNGKLNPEVAEKAKRMRKLKACWKCWIQKVPCSEGDTCERCEKLNQFSPSSDQLCCRTGFKDYEEVFFPVFMHAHLKKHKIEDLISEHTSGFSNGTLNVEVSTGAIFNPMKLHANIFRAKTNGLLRQSRLTTGSDERNSEFVERDSLPIGMTGLSPSEMRKVCKQHIEEMIASPGYSRQVCAGDGSSIAFPLLLIMQKYAKEIPLVKKALMLHAIHYFMSTLVTFTPSSARSIYRHLRYRSTPLDPFLSSRLLNRQIKHIMHKLHREITASVLESLERSLRSRTKDYWGPSFGAILILCLCMENLETAADTLVVCDMLKDEGREGFQRNQSLNACMTLEEFPFAQCQRLLHEIYRSHKEGNGGARDAGFNPLRALYKDEPTGLDGEADEMVFEVYGVVFEKWLDIVELAKRGPLIGTDCEVNPGEIRPHNTGRLAAKFLQSFLPDI